MAVYEDRDTQAQHYWQARQAHERLTISESIAEVLADTTTQEQWTDEDEQGYGRQASGSTALVPPRLSLQSKVLSSVRPVTFVQSVTAELAAQHGAAKEQEEGQKPSSLLTRLAQRFTSSLAAFGASMQPEPETLFVAGGKRENEMVERRLVAQPSAYTMTPAPVAQTPLATVIDAIPATPSTPPPHPVQSKQRLAGHTSKIHLQNAPAPKVPQPRPKERANPEWSKEYREPVRELRHETQEMQEMHYAVTREPIREPLTLNIRLRERVQETIPCSNIPVLTPLTPEETDRVTQSAKSSVSKREHTFFSYFGAGLFESGQSETMVRNPQTVASSVVQVMLTSNPGPTLIQYVSLYPEVGFTLHLTAPATAKTTFNYVMLTDARA